MYVWNQEELNKWTEEYVRGMDEEACQKKLSRDSVYSIIIFIPRIQKKSEFQYLLCLEPRLPYSISKQLTNRKLFVFSSIFWICIILALNNTTDFANCVLFIKLLVDYMC